MENRIKNTFKYILSKRRIELKSTLQIFAALLDKLRFTVLLILEMKIYKTRTLGIINVVNRSFSSVYICRIENRFWKN